MASPHGQARSEVGDRILSIQIDKLVGTQQHLGVLFPCLDVVVLQEIQANPQFALDNEIDDPRFDPSKARYNVLEPGELSLHHVLLVHGSEPNTSPRRRAGVTFRYMPSASHFDRAMSVTNASSIVPVEFTQRPIWLVRGVDRCGRNDFATGHWWE